MVTSQPGTQHPASTPPAHRQIALTILGVALTGFGAGCAAYVADPTPEPSAASVCDQVMAALPDRVADQSRNDGDQRYVRQWGGPPIVLRCGVDKPAELEPTSRCDVVNEVGWFSQEQSDGVRFTTIGRAVYIDVFVPDAYYPEANALVDVAQAITRDPIMKDCV